MRITGEIGWDTTSDSFRSQVDQLIKDGVKDVHLYINSPGGSCFDANEIVNILSRFTGTVTGEGGAIVASAATYIAEHCSSFSMPENGEYMVHKPSGIVCGKASDMEAYLKLLRDIEAEYYKTYKAKAADINKFDEYWNSNTDYWMTATEAKEQGFVTSVVPKVKIDKETAAMITACGRPIPNDYKPPLKNENMDLKVMALKLGLPESATEQDINAAIEANKNAALELERYKQEQQQKEQQQKKDRIKARLEKAVKEKIITADVSPKWEKFFETDETSAEAALSAIQPVEKLSDQIETSGVSTGKTYQGKTFEQLQQEDPAILAQLHKDNPTAYDQLFQDWKKRNKV